MTASVKRKQLNVFKVIENVIDEFTRVALLIDTCFVRYLFVAMFEQVSSITVETAEECTKSLFKVQQ